MVQQRKPALFGNLGLPRAATLNRAKVSKALWSVKSLRKSGQNLLEYKPLRIDRKKNLRGHDFEHHAYIGSIEGAITILPDELIGFGWFTLADLERMRDQLRDPFILDIARAVFEGNL